MPRLAIARDDMIHAKDRGTSRMTSKMVRLGGRVRSSERENPLVMADVGKACDKSPCPWRFSIQGRAFDFSNSDQYSIS